MFQRLAHLDPAVYGAVTSEDDEPDVVPTLRFDDEAQLVFNDWLESLERRIRSGELPDAFESHLGKYRSLMPALALLFHLVDADPSHSEYVGAVGVDAALQATAWVEYLESHAKRVYASAVSPSLERAVALLRRITRGDVREGCRVRDIYAHGWQHLQTIEEADDVLRTLESYSWVRTEERGAGSKGGRPTRIVHLNPVLRAANRGGDADDDED